MSFSSMENILCSLASPWYILYLYDKLYIDIIWSYNIFSVYICGSFLPQMNSCAAESKGGKFVGFYSLLHVFSHALIYTATDEQASELFRRKQQPKNISRDWYRYWFFSSIEWVIIGVSAGGHSPPPQKKTFYGRAIEQKSVCHTTTTNIDIKRQNKVYHSI
jgi:hypothetical protein